VLLYRGEKLVTGVFRQDDGTQVVVPEGQRPSGEVRMALLRAETRQGPGWGEPVFQDGEVYANYAAVLALPAGPPLVVVAAVSLTRLSVILAAISEAFDTTAFILDGRDRVFAHPALAAGHSGLGPSAVALPSDQLDDPVLDRFATREWMDPFAPARQRGVEVSFLDVDGAPYIIVDRRIEVLGPRPWRIGAYFRGAAVSEEIARLTRVIAISVAALVAAVILSLIAARLITLPVRRLTARAALITDLELDRVEALPASRVRELDQAATSFNAMLDGLKAFAAYVPRALVARLIRSGIDAATASDEREMTVMFTDIVGFTELAEQLPAAETAHLLNRHFAVLSEIVERHGGTVDKFLGDGMMAFWGAPEAMADHAAAACRAARDIASAVSLDYAAATAAGRPGIRIRIGIHSGQVIVGNIGGKGRINYTVIGDVVNVCQRLQGLGHTLDPAAPVAAFLSAETAGRAGAGIASRPAGDQPIRGRREGVEARQLVFDQAA
jgi:adenylate cyclase